MYSKKWKKRFLPLTMAAIMMLSCFPAMAANEDPWSITGVEPKEQIITVGDTEYTVTRYTDHYLKDTGALKVAEKGAMFGGMVDLTGHDQYENARVNIYIPEGADESTPILYMVDNSGWQSNLYIEDIFSHSQYGNYAKRALEEGYVIVNAGLRTRVVKDVDGNYNHAPVTVADAKAVIRYLKYNDDKIPGDADRIFITGTSGGGALSAAIGSNGNSADFYEELFEIGAVGMTDSKTSTIDDSVFGVVAYCPITDLGHADGSYEYTYANTRIDLKNTKFDSDGGACSYSDTTLSVSDDLAFAWAQYVNGLNLVDENGNALTAYFDTAKLEASGSLYDGMKNLLIASLQDGLNAAGTVEAFEQTLIANRPLAEKDRYGRDVYVGGTPLSDDWQTNWVTYSEDGKKIIDIDMDGYLYYVALGEALKNAPAFTNQGTVEALMNENNLFGAEKEEYGFLTEVVWNLEAEGGILHEAYGTWGKYMEKNGDLLALQTRMVDSIAYLADDSDGDSAGYWWVRHGSNDRDTGFANQTLLYYALMNDKTIDTLDFKFAFGKVHQGSYDLDEVVAFIDASMKDADEKEAAQQPATPPVTDTPVKPSSPDTGDTTTLPLFAVVIAVGAVVLASAKKRVVR